MSGVGRLPIAIPTGVTVAVSADNAVSVKGPKGELVKAMNKGINITVGNSQVAVTRSSDQKERRALHGSTRALISNMIIGVEKGFGESLELVGVGYRARLQGKKLVINLGCSHSIEIKPIEGVTFETPATTKVAVKSINEEKVGAAAADIRPWRKLEPYKGRGIKYDNKIIGHKEGKTGKK